MQIDLRSLILVILEYQMVAIGRFILFALCFAVILSCGPKNRADGNQTPVGKTVPTQEKASAKPGDKAQTTSVKQKVSNPLRTEELLPDPMTCGAPFFGKLIPIYYWGKDWFFGSTVMQGLRLSFRSPGAFGFSTSMSSKSKLERIEGLALAPAEDRGFFSQSRMNYSDLYCTGTTIQEASCLADIDYVVQFLDIAKAKMATKVPQEIRYYAEAVDCAKSISLSFLSKVLTPGYERSAVLTPLTVAEAKNMKRRMDEAQRLLRAKSSLPILVYP